MAGKNERYDVVEVATQTMPVIRDGKDNKQYTIEHALVLVLNKLEKMEEKIIG